jgi:hypothetical protein
MITNRQPSNGVAEALMKSIDNAQTVVKQATYLVALAAAKSLREKKAADSRAASKAAADRAASAMDAYLAGQ